jgi:Ribosomal protein L7/L12 C-terminal domain
VTVLRCDSCGGETFEALGEPGYFRCHSCGAASTVKLIVPSGGPAGGGVWLVNVGPKKIMVIKAVREITGWGLKEAKSFVDAADRTPQQIPLPAGDVGAADRAASSLTAAGAQVRR